ncbi:cell wall-binding repeat-containing protein [Microbacterium sp. H1-D42]|uniref:cell wall-binding repeat-containing protein n=1 Tax=Microbacterium sp. H1-D42 TaxID=2925844 RepID=UPI001F53833C|nr:cell wall-binding repeat-containing protein [Microbacterium sp. H1-D42]UNK71071.1 cell wall-binding repeat-containing protein [Microbacterium sp. H1-D42]
MLLISGAAPAAAAESSGSIRGEILDEVGGLLVRDERNVTIELYAGDQAKTAVLSTAVVLDFDGGFVLPDVPAGRYAIAFRPAASRLVGEWWGDTRRAADRAFVDVSAGGAVDVEVRLSSAAVVSGKIAGRDVLEAPNIAVTATSGDAELDGWLMRRTTDERMSGTYELFLPPGIYDLSFKDESGAHQPLAVRGVQVGSQPVVENVTLAAARASIAGRISVRTPSGVVPQMDGASVVAYAWSAAKQAWSSVEYCGSLWRDDDRYLVDCLAPGRYKLAVIYDGTEVFAGGMDLASAKEITVSETQTLTGIDLVIDAPVKVSGLVARRTAAGVVEAISGATVTVWRKTVHGDFAIVPDAVRGYTSHGATSDDGEIFGELVPGTYMFKIWAGSGTAATYLQGQRLFENAPQFELGPGDKLDLGTVVLAKQSFEVKRVAGPDRFATAVEVSKQIVPTGQRASVVYLTNARDFPDALAAGPAAMRANGAVLPVSESSLPANIAAELRRLNPKRIVLAGGSGVISDSVRVAAARVVPSATVVRLGGANRFQTGDRIVRDAFGAGSKYAIIATGVTYPDALAAGPAAGHLNAPVVLVDGRKGFSADTRATLTRLGVQDVFIAGGTGAVSSSIEKGLKTMLGSAHVTRLAGINRIDTAMFLNREIFGESDHGFVASSAGFADALSGGPLAAKHDAPLYLAQQKCIGHWVLDDLRSKATARLVLLGGTGVLGSGVQRLVECR